VVRSIYELTGKLNPYILGEKMYRQQWIRHSFGLFVAPQFIKATQDEADPVVPGTGETQKFSGAPIEVFRRFVTEGKTDMEIPVRIRLTGRPTFGNKPLTGKAEDAKVVYRRVKINVTRKSYNKPSLLGAQMTIPYLENLIGKASDYLTQWWNDYHPGNFMLATLTGYSADLLGPAADGGRGQSIMSHPNFYVAGSGKVSYSGGRPGSAGYEAAVESALDGLTDVAGDGMSPGFIAGLVLEAQRLKIQPILMKAGFRRFCIWISDSQWKQLSEHTDFKDWYKRLPNELDDHPLATNARADLHGAIIYVDQSMWGAWTNANPGKDINDATSTPTAGLPEYGIPPTATERSLGYKFGIDWIGGMRSVSNRKVGFLIGESFLNVGVGVPILEGKKGPSMTFTEQVNDHGAIAEIGIATVQSVIRSDSFDEDGVIVGLTKGDFHENTSSLVFATYSKDEITF
jgi:hypothetical protein